MSLFSKKEERHSIKTDRLNIIFILVDDLRYDAIGIAGNPIIKTPNIDGLANEGVYFPNTFVTTAICMASRASIMTGMLEKNHKCNFGRNGLKSKLWGQSYPVLLREAGYTTGFIGKFGFAVSDKALDWIYHSEDKLPAKDFDYWKGFPGQGNYFPKGENGKHLTNLNAEYALDFLNGCNKEQPFCLSISFKAPHGPMTPDPAYNCLFAEEEIPRPETFDSSYFELLPEAVKKSWGHQGYFNLYLNTPQKFQTYLKNYYRLIAGIDDAIGKIRQELKRLELSENTIIIFTSDNGYFTGEHLLGGKVLMYEESIKVPLIIYNPNSRDKNRGTKNDHLISNVDLAPTMLGYAGVKIPEQMDGMDISPLLKGNMKNWRSVAFCENHFSQGTEISIGPYNKDRHVNWANQYYPRSWCLRSVEFKYISYWEENAQTEELYDMVHDKSETNNLIKDPEYKQIIESFRKKLKL
ncbi:MAG: sulfatase [Bacteroidetes bacterium]|nr:sulfatase [Bacteroidota bacterium]